MSDLEGTPNPPPPVSPPIAPAPKPAEPVPLDRLPSPPWVIVLAFIAGSAFLLGLVKGPRSFMLGIKYERGERAIQDRNFAEAAKNLSAVVEAYPDADDARIDLATAYANTGEITLAIQEATHFEGKMVTTEQEAKLNQAAALIKSKLPPDEPDPNEKDKP